MISDSKIRKKRKTGSKKRELMLEQELSEKMNSLAGRTDDISKANNKNIQSHYAFNKPTIPPVCAYRATMPLKLSVALLLTGPPHHKTT